MTQKKLHVLYEDNHFIIINKSVSDLVQKDKTGDIALDDKIKKYLKEKYNKPGNVFIGIPHRIDRPVSGAVIYARTSKALSRMGVMFKDKDVNKVYWAVVKNKPAMNEGILENYMIRNTRQNKSYISTKDTKDAKLAKLTYKVVAQSDKYYLIEVNLITGRHHQVRCQLANMGCPIKGDLKYGFQRSNPDGGINLHARKISFIHPVTKEYIDITAPVPDDNLWRAFEKMVDEKL